MSAFRRGVTAPLSSRLETCQNYSKMAERNGNQRRDEFRELSREQLVKLIDVNSRKLLHVDGEEFLRLRRENKPLKNPAWEPIDLLASLLSD